MKRMIWMGMLGFFIVALFLTGCSGDNKVADPEMEEEGVELVGFYMNYQGMQMKPHYLMKVSSEGAYMKITNVSPLEWIMKKPEGVEPYLTYADRIQDDEYASLFFLEDEEPLRKLKEAIVNAGALGWDGFSKKASKSGAKDEGNHYQLFLLLSDGTTVTVNSYNDFPKGFLELLSQVEKIFEEVMGNAL